MKGVLPVLLFAGVTLGCFWKFVFLGWTLYDVRTLEGHLGTQAPAEAGWAQSNRPPVDRGDTVLSLPMLHRIYGEGLHHGELRLWNPELFCGYPIYNNLLLHPFYPPNLALHALLPPRTAYDLNLMLHFFFSGLSMFWCLRGMGRSRGAATAGGLLWMLLGYNSFWFSTGTCMGASVFGPLALLGLHRGLSQKDSRWQVAGGLALGLVILGSHGQHALHLLLFFSLWLLVALVRSKGSRSFIVAAGARFLGVALAVGMAAILTELDSVLNGLRLPGEDRLLHYAHPWALPGYILGLALGKVWYLPDGLLRSEFTIYAGVAGTLGALVGAVRGWRDPWIRFVAGVAIAALGVAFVKPLADLALAIPFLNLSMPARWVYVFGFCLTLLAAEGIDRAREDARSAARIAAPAGGLLLLFLGFHVSQGAVAETALGIALAAGWLLAGPRRPTLGLGLALAAVLVDLYPNFVLFNAHADPASLDRPFEAVDAVRAREKEPWRATGSLRRAGGPASANGWTVSIGSNLLALWGVEAVLGYESIAPLATVAYSVETSGPESVMGSGRVLALFNLKSRLVDLANMKYVFMPFLYDPEPRFRKVGSWGPLTVYENPAALPRAWIAPRATAVDGASAAARLLRSEAFDPRSTVVLETDRPLAAAGTGPGTVDWMERETDRLTLGAWTPSGGYLVVSDTDYPGWEAELDGKPTPILRADLAFRAVYVPGGSHRVTMRFRPGSATLGLWVSSLSIAAALFWLALKQYRVGSRSGILTT